MILIRHLSYGTRVNLHENHTRFLTNVFIMRDELPGDNVKDQLKSIAPSEQNFCVTPARHTLQFSYYETKKHRHRYRRCFFCELPISLLLKCRGLCSDSN